METLILNNLTVEGFLDNEDELALTMNGEAGEVDSFLARDQIETLIDHLTTLLSDD